MNDQVASNGMFGRSFDHQTMVNSYDQNMVSNLNQNIRQHSIPNHAQNIYPNYNQAAHNRSFSYANHIQQMFLMSNQQHNNFCLDNETPRNQFNRSDCHNPQLFNLRHNTANNTYANDTGLMNSQYYNAVFRGTNNSTVINNFQGAYDPNFFQNTAHNNNRCPKIKKSKTNSSKRRKSGKIKKKACANNDYLHSNMGPKNLLRNSNVPINEFSYSERIAYYSGNDNTLQSNIYEPEVNSNYVQAHNINLPYISKNQPGLGHNDDVNNNHNGFEHINGHVRNNNQHPTLQFAVIMLETAQIHKTIY
uniref:GATA zinc finger domain-containing protein 14-like n=1 Tax=Rhabditophanes sp. KR3021 TaxID=114890 RepID=A0AC35TM89_9BILA